MGSRERHPLPWTPVVGRRAATGLRWLEQAAGPRAVQKFLGGKARHPLFSGRYLCGIHDCGPGRRLIADLLDQLRRGKTIPLCDVDSYYAAGKRWPLGMAVRDGQLVDIWPADPPAASIELPS
ncbi:MAG TPA: hypothetical protein VFA75_01825 [Nevskia sp.]|nr:hypothetical protein [Nevskia sp.]